MDAMEARVLNDISTGHVYLDGCRNVRVDPGVVVGDEEQAAYIRAVRKLIKDELVMEDWRVAEGAERELWLTSTGDAAWRAAGFASPTALVYAKGAFEAVAQ